VYLEKQVWDFILKAKKKRLQNLFQIFPKNNRLKCRFNRLLHASIAGRKAILSGIAYFVNFLYLNASISGFQDILSDGRGPSP